ncbi:DIP1984 family protein [Deinococcus alpinitundrae]|uniref:DIP1984 family protein n=1 Tax=Deinococcus alpinitundrae TaxID=468913 RepID=UPI0013793FB8|nr:DIP1984 family protein [Deinococcus alpinitundrae]
MKLAEALIERADLQKRAAQLQQRIQLNARSQEGEPPSEDPVALLAELNGIFDRLDDLIPRLHRSNAAARLDESRTLTDALAHREVLDLRLAAQRSATEAASTSQVRSTRSELRWVSHLPVRELQARTDRLARERRELEAEIQQANWQHDLLE